MADININTVATIGTVLDTDYLHLTIGGTHNRLSISTLLAKANENALSEVEAGLLNYITEGCYIFYFNQSKNVPKATKASEWTALQNKGEVATGVMIEHGDLHIVLAPTESAKQLYWSSENVLASTLVSSQLEKLNDFNGKEKTAAILADATIGGDGADYAPGFCAAYSRLNVNGKGLRAGSWWLPSCGELLFILANKQKINVCLQLITGGTPLHDDYYWASTEHSAAYAGIVSMAEFAMYGQQKTAMKEWVRPVTNFYNVD